MKPAVLPTMLLALGLAAFQSASAHLFTDDQGRQVEAELVGLRGPNVVLATQGVRGQWPVARLAAPDQAYVKQWQAGSTVVKRVVVQMNERDGMGEKGTFKSETSDRPGLPKDLPFAPQIDSKETYKHYDLQITNPAGVDASHLHVDYVLYVIQPDGSVGTNAGTQALDILPAGKTTTLKTEAATAKSTKTSKLKLAVSSNSISTTEKISRSRERFGGGWVRVTGADGGIIGEAKQLTAELAKLDPPWVGTDRKDTSDVPVLKSLDGLRELLKNFPKPPETKESPSLPPGFPPKF